MTPSVPVPIELRAATVHDIDAVADLVQSAYRGEPSRVGWTTEADLLTGQRTDVEALRTTLADPATVVLVGYQGEVLTACAQLTGRGDAVEFGMFSVRPGAQGGGLGAQVLGAAERFAGQRWSAGRMELMVIRQRSELIAWYERRGYRLTGETRPFPYGNERYGVPTRDDLEFVVLVKQLPAVTEPGSAGIPTPPG